MTGPRDCPPCPDSATPAETEAAAWLVRLVEAPGDPVLEAAFAAWRDACPENAETWERTRRAYALIGRTAPRHGEYWREARARTECRPQGRPVRFRRWVPALAALAALLLVMLAPELMLRLEADIATATGETRTLSLADGSEMSLAPDSAVAIHISDQERQVRLLKGEAYFEVRPDPRRPFAVQARATRVTVLDTMFVVRREEDRVSVSVRQGRVGVEDASAPAHVLKAGDWLRVSRQGEVAQGTMPVDDVADWRQGRLVARGLTIGEIVATLRRYHKGFIVVADQAFAARRVSGIYELGEPEKTLRELAASHGASVTKLSPWLLVVRAG